MAEQHHAHVTRINFDNGTFLQAPTDQWIALLFDVLHPTQQEAIFEKINALAQSQKDKPLVEIPGFAPPADVVRH